MRTSVVLSADGGALPKITAPFRFGVGGKLGRGDQWFSWITLDDMVRAMGKTAFSGRSLGEAVDVLEAMAKDPDCLIVVTLSGAMTVAKMSTMLIFATVIAPLSVWPSTLAIAAARMKKGNSASSAR